MKLRVMLEGQEITTGGRPREATAKEGVVRFMVGEPYVIAEVEMNGDDLAVILSTFTLNCAGRLRACRMLPQFAARLDLLLNEDKFDRTLAVYAQPAQADHAEDAGNG